MGNLHNWRPQHKPAVITLGQMHPKSNNDVAPPKNLYTETGGRSGDALATLCDASGGSGDGLGHSREALRRSGDALGTLWGWFGDILGETLGMLRRRSGDASGSGDALGHSGNILGRSRDTLGMVWNTLGMLWGCSGDALAPLETFWQRSRLWGCPGALFWEHSGTL